MYDPNQFRDLIVRTLSAYPELLSDAAVNLLLGTSAQESRFGTYLRQLGRGPAVGAFQMEPNTFDWLQDVYGKEYGFENRKAEDMEWDLKLAILLSRLRYRVVPKSIPSKDDIPGMAAYWNKYYNCNPIYGTDAEFISNYRKYVQGG